MIMDTKQNLSVGGYVFYTERDAALAEAELKKIDYVEARVDYNNPESILKIYTKMVDERIFKTPIGLQYLNKIREYLLQSPEIDPEDVTEIRLYTNFGSGVRDKGEQVQNRIKRIEKNRDEVKDKLTVSIILNVLLVGAIVVMFLITLKSDNPNIINYKKAITNQYASWEQELTEREEAIREKEKELSVQQWKD